jgi:hypothetical protein
MTLGRLLLPLSAFALDAGVSVSDMNSLFREAAVLSAASGQINFGGRINISGIAATTGMPRGEISRILKSSRSAMSKVSDAQLQPVNRVLLAWRRDPRFLNPNGRPSDLAIYGRGKSFDSLVRAYGHGIPTRAMADELTRTGAIEVAASMKIRMNSSVSTNPGLTPHQIKSLGDRVVDILSNFLILNPIQQRGSRRRNFRRTK